MSTTTRTSAVLVSGLVVLLAIVGAGGAAAAQSGPSVGFSGVADSITLGNSDEATVEFADVNDADGVGSFTVIVTYDPDAVSVSASSTSEFSIQTATPELGVLRVTGYTDGHPGPIGSGSLFDLTVTGEGEASSVTLGLETETLTDADGNDLAVATGSTTLSVEASDGGGGGGGGGGGQPVGGGPTGDVGIVDSELLNDTVSVGTPAVTAVELSNPDPMRGKITLSLVADGSVLIEESVAVGPSTGRTVYLKHQFGRPGTYELSVNGASVGTVEVEGAATGITSTPTAVPGTPTSTAMAEFGSDRTTPTERESSTEEPEVPETTSGDGAGFGTLAALLAIGLTLLAARRLD